MPISASDPFGDTCAEAAVWLCDDLGLSLPPLFAQEIEALQECATGRIFATQRDLARLSTRGALLDRLAAGAWPPSGVAFGLLHEGLIGRWFYVRATERALVLLSLRIAAQDEAAHRASLRMVDAQHAAMARWLSPTGDFAALTGSGEGAAGGMRRVVLVDDFDGVLRVRQARHGPTGLSDWAPLRTSGAALPSGNDWIQA